MQKKIKLSSQLKKNLIQKAWFEKEFFADFEGKIKQLDTKKDWEKITEIQKKFVWDIEKKLQEMMMKFAKSQDFKFASFLRNLLFEFQNEVKSEKNFDEDLKKICWTDKNIRKIACLDVSENFWCKIFFENWIFKKEKTEFFEKKNFVQNWENPNVFLEKIFQNEIKKIQNFLKNQKKSEEKFIWKKLNKKDFEKIFLHQKSQNSNLKKADLKKQIKEDLEKFFWAQEKILKEKNIKINYFWCFEKVNFDEKKAEKNFIWFIPVWKFDNKNFEIIFENPDKNWQIFWKNFNEIFWDFISFLWKNFTEKNFFIFWNSKNFEKNFNNFWIKKIKTLNWKKLSDDFWIIPENIAKYWPNKNQKNWFIWKFSTEKIENDFIIPDLLLINSEKNFWNDEKKFLENAKIFVLNKKNLNEKKDFFEWKKFLEKVFGESDRGLKRKNLF